MTNRGQSSELRKTKDRLSSELDKTRILLAQTRELQTKEKLNPKSSKEKLSSLSALEADIVTRQQKLGKEFSAISQQLKTADSKVQLSDAGARTSAGGRQSTSPHMPQQVRAKNPPNLVGKSASNNPSYPTSSRSQLGEPPTNGTIIEPPRSFKGNVKNAIEAGANKANITGTDKYPTVSPTGKDGKPAPRVISQGRLDQKASPVVSERRTSVPNNPSYPTSSRSQLGEPPTNGTIIEPPRSFKGDVKNAIEAGANKAKNYIMGTDKYPTVSPTGKDGKPATQSSFKVSLSSTFRNVFSDKQSQKQQKGEDVSAPLANGHK